MLLIFARIGSAAILLPGIGENYVSARVRLLFAGAITVVPIHSDCDPVSGPEMAAARVMPLVWAVSPESCPARISWRRLTRRPPVPG